MTTIATTFIIDEKGESRRCIAATIEQPEAVGDGTEESHCVGSERPEAWGIMDRERVRVLVVGSGVGSLAVAAFLRQSGYAVTRAEEPDGARPAGVVVARNGVRLLSLLPGNVLEHGVPSQELTVRDHLGAKVGEEPDHGIVGIGRDELTRALATVADVQVKPAVTQLVPVETGVRVTHGGAAEYDLVVGADGAHSRVRALLFPKQAVTDAPFVMVSFLAQGDPADRTSERILGNGVTLTHVPIGGGLRLVRAVLASTKSKVEVAEVRDAVGAAAKALFDGMLADTLVLEGLVEQIAPRWSEGAVLLVGNAAHPLHPLLDQDPAMTFEDGRALQVALDRSETVAHALAAFEHMRKERVHSVHKSSWALASAGQKRSGFAASFRGVLHRLAPSLWPRPAVALDSSTELDQLVSHRPDLTPLTEEARQFLRFLVKIGQVDGRFDEAERTFMRGSLQESGHFATDEEISAIEDEVRRQMTREIVQPFKDRPMHVRESVLEAGVLMAAASGRIASDEHKALREAAHALEISPEVHERLVADAMARESSVG